MKKYEQNQLHQITLQVFKKVQIHCFIHQNKQPKLFSLQ